MKKYTVQQTADRYGVTYMAVQHWIKKGLKFSTVREIGRKEYRVLDENDVKEFLDLDTKE